ncbi:hypothetical protein COOONC_06518 [Cooperia oncophora]
MQGDECERGVLALCVLCGWTFRPLQFREVSEEEEAEDSIEMKKPKDTAIEENAALLISEKSQPAIKVRDFAREAKSLEDISASDEEHKNL